jgi:hypothetical protein
MVRIYIPKETFFSNFSENVYNFYKITGKTSETLISTLHELRITVVSKYNFIVCYMDTMLPIPEL